MGSEHQEGLSESVGQAKSGQEPSRPRAPLQALAPSRAQVSPDAGDIMIDQGAT